MDDVVNANEVVNVDEVVDVDDVVDVDEVVGVVDGNIHANSTTDLNNCSALAIAA